jgi:hypothetical protein
MFSGANYTAKTIDFTLSFKTMTQLKRKHLKFSGQLVTRIVVEPTVKILQQRRVSYTVTRLYTVYY